MIASNDVNLVLSRSLVTPCCHHRYHMECVQQMALNSGLFHVKCPVCSDRKQFLSVCVRLGIYVPEQDAAWEDPGLDNFYNFSTMGNERNCWAAAAN